MKKRDSVCIGDLYGDMLNSVRKTIKESKDDNAFGKTPKLDGKGPKVNGYNDAMEDEEFDDEEDEETPKYKKTKGEKVGEFYSTGKAKKEDTDDKEVDSDETKKKAFWNKKNDEDLKESKKITTNRLNSFMSKSVFDKLYSKVLKENFGQEEGGDIDALGLDGATPDSGMDDDFGGEDDFGDEGEGDSVTFTLDRATAQTLIDVLQGALGGGEEDFGDEGDDLDFGDEGDDFGGEDDGMDFEEDEEVGTKVAPDKKAVFQSKSNKVAGPPAPKSGKAKADVTDDTNTTQGAPPITALQGKNNQVPGSTLKKASDYFK